MACIVDNDCPGFQLCYQNTSVSWLEETECICNTEHGLLGVDCSEFGPASYYGVVTLILLAIFDVIGLIGAKFMVYRLIVGKEMKFNSMGVTLILVTTAFAVQLIRDLVLMTIYFTPQLQTTGLTISGDKIQKGHVLIFGIRLLVGFEILLTFMCALNVSLLWIEIASRSKNFRKNTGELLNNYRRAVIVMEVVLFLALCVTTALGNFALISFIILPLLVIAALTFVYGQRRIGALLTDTTANDKKYGNIARNIRRCAIAICVLVFVLLIFVGITAFLASRGYKESTPAGQVSLYVIANIGLYYTVTILAYVLLVYVYSHLKAKIVRTGSKTYMSGDTSKDDTPTGAPASPTRNYGSAVSASL